MLNSLRLRAIFYALICIIALFFLTPTLVKELPDFWKQKLPSDKIRLGLDLQGGMHLVLEVDTEKAIESMLERFSGNLRDTLMAQKIRFRNVERTGQTVSLELTNPADRVELGKIIHDIYQDYVIISSSPIGDGRERVFLGLKKSRVDEIKKMTVEQSLETIRNRIDQFGITEPEIIPQGDDRILIQLPGVTDANRAKSLIGKTALLEFKLVDDKNSLDEALRGNIPAGSVIAHGAARRGEVYLLKEKALLSGDALESARVEIGDRFGAPHVSMRFNSQGARDFERITGENVKKQLAIVLDGIVYSAPVIRDRIAGGQAIIEGSFTMEQARDLAIVLRAGALPAPVNILEERTVGPSLGQDSIRSGIWSCLASGLLIILFMAFYYRLSGMIANLALVLNIVMLLGFMAMIKATLTLPGIAGIILIIGIAVDANVLICERIREEMRIGKTPRAAVEAGYAKAFLTIFDTNITSFIVALFLFGFGAGPVKGFAVTLTIGIITSMFTSVYITRLVYDYILWNFKVEKLSI